MNKQSQRVRGVVGVAWLMMIPVVLVALVAGASWWWFPTAIWLALGLIGYTMASSCMDGAANGIEVGDSEDGTPRTGRTSRTLLRLADAVTRKRSNCYLLVAHTQQYANELLEREAKVLNALGLSVHLNRSGDILTVDVPLCEIYAETRETAWREDRQGSVAVEFVDHAVYE